MSLEGSVVRVSPEFFARDATVVAPDLLNKILAVDTGGVTVTGRIVETEAYRGADDPGSHGYNGITPRTEVMFGRPGVLYVYFTYGMHWCANVVTQTDGECGAVLLRAVEPVDGIEHMRARRTAKPRKAPLRDRDLCNGPAKLCQAFGLNGDQDGLNLYGDHPAVHFVDDRTPPPDKPGNSTRVGLSAGADIRWRWFVRGNPHVSKAPRSSG